MKLLIFIFMVFTINVNAQYIKIQPDNLGSSRSWFGAFTCLRDSILVIGAHWDYAPYNNSGSAFIYRKDENGWFQEQKLIPKDPFQANRFGNSVSVSGNWALVGCQDDSYGGTGFYIGSAYMFFYNGQEWTEWKKFTPPDTSDYQFFGTTVSIYNNYALIGSNNSINSSLYLYKYEDNEWIEINRTNQYGIGYSLSMYDNYVISGDGDKSFIYEISNDSLIYVHTLQYGEAVSISDNYAIGSSEYVNNGLGAAVIYKREGSNWIFDSFISGSDSNFGDRFGASVSINEGIALVGAYTDDQSGENSGSVYLYEKMDNAWIQRKKMVPNDINQDYLFGLGLSISNHELVIGAPHDNSVYIYDIEAVTKIEHHFSNYPFEFLLLQNYPNPYNASTTIRFYIPKTEYVTIEILNSLGQRIGFLVNEKMGSGDHIVRFDGSKYSSGIYFYKITAGKFFDVKKMLLIK